MALGLLALAIAAAFTGAAMYINIAEHPARMRLELESALTQWKAAYERGALMQATLALLGGLAAVGGVAATGDWRYLVGGAVLIANWPYTLFVIMPLNKRLMTMNATSIAAEVRALLNHWNLLHAARSGLGALATVLLTWAALP